MILDSEKALIGALMIDPQAVKECGSLLPEMFTDSLLGRVYLQYLRVYLQYLRAYDFGYPANLVTLAENMPDVPRTQLLDCLKECSDSTIVSTAAGRYANAVVSAYKARKASQLINAIVFSLPRQNGKLGSL